MRDVELDLLLLLLLLVGGVAEGVVLDDAAFERLDDDDFLADSRDLDDDDFRGFTALVVDDERVVLLLVDNEDVWPLSLPSPLSLAASPGYDAFLVGLDGAMFMVLVGDVVGGRTNDEDLPNRFPEPLRLGILRGSCCFDG